MAHGRAGPDIVMQTRYAGVSEIRAVSDHEAHRHPDGSSAIDPLRSHLNKILLGPATQQEALDSMWEKGVRKPTQQAERPYVQTVLSASPDFFCVHDDEGAISWDQDKIDLWVKETMKWLKAEYGDDLAHVSLHMDETTPHLHVLIVPTYEKKPRKPAQKLKAKVPETDSDYAIRLKEWEDGGPTTRTAGRASSPYWSKPWARKDARASYHGAMEHLGLGYGKDFVGEGENSPENKKTGAWVREEVKRLADERAAIAIDRVAMVDDVKISARRITEDAEVSAISMTTDAKRIMSEAIAERNLLTKDRAQLNCDRFDLEVEREEVNRHKGLIGKALELVQWAVDELSDRMGVKWPSDLAGSLMAMRSDIQNLSLPSEEPCDEADRPGL